MQNGTDPRTIRLPLLIGALVDVSSSMAEQISNSRQSSQTRLEALRDSLDDLVQRVRDYCADVDEDPSTLLNIFVYGFGFGNLLTRARGLRIPSVQSLLTSEGDDPLLTGQELLDRWAEIKFRVAKLSREMLGATPMVAAFAKAESTFAALRKNNQYRDSPILLVISDGVPTDPTDAGPELVLACADRMRDEGIVIASCFVARRDVTLPRTLYETAMPDWKDGPRLMFDCASPTGDFAAIAPELKDHGWHIPAGARLFGQVNQSELLSEFVAAVVPSLPDRQSNKTAEVGLQNKRKVRVFVSYSHVDARYIDQRDSLLSYVSGLEQEGISFWCDRRINAGELWDIEIKLQLDESDIALVLVSQAFLNSEYCRNVEASTFVEARRRNGLIIVPVLVSACDWKSVEWLRQTQFIPRDGRNIEQHMVQRGRRMAFYLEVLEELRTTAETIRDLPARPT
jgi:hypothetical protein